MREIKFRGYAKEELTSSQWLTNGFGVDKVKYVDGTSSVFLLTPYGEYVVEESSVGQYTGLKDKNGKEIYEGDIVETCEHKKQLVVWHNNGFKLKYTYSRTYQGEPYTETTHLELGDTSSRRWGDEVIGNIYENPELLK